MSRKQAVISKYDLEAERHNRGKIAAQTTGTLFTKEKVGSIGESSTRKKVFRH